MYLQHEIGLSLKNASHLNNEIKTKIKKIIYTEKFNRQIRKITKLTKTRSLFSTEDSFKKIRTLSSYEDNGNSISIIL